MKPEIISSDLNAKYQAALDLLAEKDKEIERLNNLRLEFGEKFVVKDRRIAALEAENAELKAGQARYDALMDAYVGREEHEP